MLKFSNIDINNVIIDTVPYSALKISFYAEVGKSAFSSTLKMRKGIFKVI